MITADLQGCTIMVKITGTAFQNDVLPHSLLGVVAQLGLWFAQEPTLDGKERGAPWKENLGLVD